MNQFPSKTAIWMSITCGIIVCLCIMTTILTGCIMLLPDQNEEPTEVYYITSPAQKDQSYL